MSASLTELMAPRKELHDDILACANFDELPSVCLNTTWHFEKAVSKCLCETARDIAASRRRFQDIIVLPSRH